VADADSFDEFYRSNRPLWSHRVPASCRCQPGPGLAVGAASARTVFMSVLDGSTIRPYRSDDGGATWAVAATAPDRVTQGGGTGRGDRLPDGAGGLVAAGAWDRVRHDRLGPHLDRVPPVAMSLARGHASSGAGCRLNSEW
jgi:hypothetical protein